jgi:hypothetical protein
MNKLLDFWSQFRINENSDLIHEEDSRILDKESFKYIRNFEDYVSNVDNLFSTKTVIHSGLVPVPYTGDIEKARVYLLLLNPGFNHNDYYSESNGIYRNILIKNIYQDLDKDYPFLYLNPRFCHTSGGNYWLKKFGSIIDYLYSQKKWSYATCIKLISQKVCTLELFPYHSRNFGLSQKIINQCPSVLKIKEFLKDKYSKNSDLLVACLRNPESWGLLDNYKNIHILLPEQRQSASIKIERQIGRSIFDKIIE